MNILSRGSSMASRSLMLPQAVTEKLQSRFLERGRSSYDYSHFTSVIQESAEIVHRTIPDELKEQIRQVTTSDIGFMQLQGLPQDPELMPTPEKDNVIESEKRTFVKERFTIGLSHMIGLEVFNYAQEGWGQGKLIFNVFPVKEMLNLKGAGGTSANFGFHTENAWHPTAIKCLFLVGMRQDHEKKAETYAVSVADIVKELSEEEINILSRENFVLDPPEIHRKMEQLRGIPFAASESFVGPILSQTEAGCRSIRVNFNGMRALNNPRAQEVLNKVERIAKQLASTFFLQRDNMLIINNMTAVHTRNGYQARFDGNDRWFQRYYLTDSNTLWKGLQVTPGDFAGLLPETTARSLMQLLQWQGYLDGQGRITALFKPYEKDFIIKLPESIMPLELEIRKRLILKGPAFPNRVV